MPTKKGYKKALSDDLEVSLISDNKYNSGTSITSNTSPMDRFRRYEEDFLNSSRIVSRGLKELSNTGGIVGKYSNLCILILILTVLPYVLIISSDQVIAVSVEVDSELSETEGYVSKLSGTKHHCIP
jgi:hypothetical protein